MQQRSVALDAIKGGLVLAMVAYHACYVAVMFGLSRIDLFAGFWWVFPRAIAASFVALSGWNLAAKRARGAAFGAFARRAGSLALVAAVISGATYPVLGKSFVFFGIMHLLALSSLLAYPLLGRPRAAIACAAVAAAAGLALGEPRFSFPWLAWLGLRPAELYPADYLPLAPWFAFIALGAAARDLAAGLPAWAARGSGSASERGKPPRALGALAAIGRRSLAVYLVHLPLLFGLGWAISRLATRAAR